MFFVAMMIALAACVCLGIAECRVRFVKRYDDYDVGDLADTDSAGAAQLVREGIAVLDEDGSSKSRRRSTPDRPRLSRLSDLDGEDRRFGYKRSNDFFMDVKAAGSGDHKARERLTERSTKALGTDEYATVEDSIGGFLVPPEFRADLLSKGVEPEFVMNPALGNAFVTSINSTMLKMNAEVDVTRAGDVLFGGVQVYRVPERVTMTPARGKFEQIEWKPEDLCGLAFVTDSQLHHASNIAQILGRQFRDAMQYKRTGEFLFGSGIGASLGAFHSGNGSLISHARAASGTISLDDVLGMRTKCYGYSGAVWMASPDTLPALLKLSVNVGTGGSAVMLFKLADQDGIDTLAGRPIVFTEFAATIGGVNDLMLASWPSYVVCYTSRMVNDSSIHVRYESNETAFRFVEQFQGLPWWRTTLTRRNGLVQSPFITLGAAA